VLDIYVCRGYSRTLDPIHVRRLPACQAACHGKTPLISHFILILSAFGVICLFLDYVCRVYSRTLDAIHGRRLPACQTTTVSSQPFPFRVEIPFVGFRIFGLFHVVLWLFGKLGLVKSGVFHGMSTSAVVGA